AAAAASSSTELLADTGHERAGLGQFFGRCNGKRRPGGLGEGATSDDVDIIGENFEPCRDAIVGPVQFDQQSGSRPADDSFRPRQKVDLAALDIDLNYARRR